MTRIFALLIILFSLAIVPLRAQTLTANAGSDAYLCPGQTVVLGGSPTASGGTAPYQYLWTVAINLSSVLASNPIAQPAQPFYYVLRVIDANQDTVFDTVFVNLDPVYAYNAGPDQTICAGSSVTIGNAANDFIGGVDYVWTPSSTLNNPLDPRPLATPTQTTVYTVTINSPNCPSKQDQMTVTVHPKPVVDATGAATIYEGENTVLSATGASNYVWQPSQTTANPYLANVNAEPTQTTTYTVTGTDANGCVDEDTVTVTVIPSSEIVIYNTFSPNGDYVNDTWYIGNIYKYPNNRLDVFDRTGQLVFAKGGYDNTWDGTNYGDSLPAGTYYFVLDLGDGFGVVRGAVTIIR